ncbi:MAG: hypothetical protein AAGE96_00220 [Cyanobacteria bacterium P01_G01_bin.19]
MTQDRDVSKVSSDNVLGEAAKNIRTLAEDRRGDSLFLLSLLRDLEKIHRQIRVEFFEGALPQTRNDLYQFVKDIEEKGGWPYIERMRLIDLMSNIEQEREIELNRD